MKTTELREKSVGDLESILMSLREDQFKLNMQKATGQLAQTHLLKENRTAIARVKTVLTEKSGERK